MAGARGRDGRPIPWRTRETCESRGVAEHEDSPAGAEAEAGPAPSPGDPLAGVRAAFLETAAVAGSVLARPEVARRWQDPSALRLLSVRGLAGHLLRGVGTVETYLDQPEPAGAAPISAAAYYARVSAAATDEDLAAAAHVSVRRRGEEQAAAGPESVATEAAALLERLRGRLAAEPAGRLVSTFQGTVLRLDDYLVTRLVELVLHVDDLCASAGVPTPGLPAAATSAAIATLVGTARLRHGDAAVLRALARRERDAAQALRVL
jgi:Mycothiol maleylpyruvate isomerase N-terminal domain